MCLSACGLLVHYQMTEKYTVLVVRMIKQGLLLPKELLVNSVDALRWRFFWQDLLSLSVLDAGAELHEELGGQAMKIFEPPIADMFERIDVTELKAAFLANTVPPEKLCAEVAAEEDEVQEEEWVCVLGSAQGIPCGAKIRKL